MPRVSKVNSSTVLCTVTRKRCPPKDVPSRAATVTWQWTTRSLSERPKFPCIARSSTGFATSVVSYAFPFQYASRRSRSMPIPARGNPASIGSEGRDDITSSPSANRTTHCPSCVALSTASPCRDSRGPRVLWAVAGRRGARLSSAGCEPQGTAGMGGGKIGAAAGCVGPGAC